MAIYIGESSLGYLLKLNKYFLSRAVHYGMVEKITFLTNPTKVDISCVVYFPSFVRNRLYDFFSLQSSLGVKPAFIVS